MKKLAALAALPLLALTACSSGSGDAASSSSSSSSTSVQRDATYANATAVKDALVASGAQSCDEWKPLDTPSDPTFESEGSCGEQVRIVTTKRDELAIAEATVKLASDDVVKALKDPEAAAKYHPQYVQGPNWVVQVPDRDEAALVIVYLGGQNSTASATPAP